MINNKLETITPEAAARLLATNDSGEFLNRPRDASVVVAYARDMASGRWRDKTGRQIANGKRSSALSR